MKQFAFKKIDAFATTKSGGNPAGYIRLNSASDITHTEMHKIAKELKGFVNEVGFLYSISDTLFNLKFYSSEREVDFCGHATVAIMYDVIKSDKRLRHKQSIRIQTNKGELEVENRIAAEDAVFIMSPVPEEKTMSLDAAGIAKNLKTRQDAVDDQYPIKIINAGLNTLLVPIKSNSELLQLHPDFDELKNFCIASAIDIVEVFTQEVTHPLSDFRTRVFAPTFGYLEDPATGSGNSAFGYYLLQNKLFDKATITIEQNGSKNSFNIVKLQKKADNSGRERILFGGGAITRIEGNYFLQ
jgi:PhzF family phenazine biosynthesis protein